MSEHYELRFPFAGGTLNVTQFDPGTSAKASKLYVYLAIPDVHEPGKNLCVSLDLGEAAIIYLADPSIERVWVFQQIDLGSFPYLQTWPKAWWNQVAGLNYSDLSSRVPKAWLDSWHRGYFEDEADAVSGLKRILRGARFEAKRAYDDTLKALDDHYQRVAPAWALADLLGGE